MKDYILLDYGWNAVYFITICTKNRQHFFCKISDGQMALSAIGEIANRCWLQISGHFPFVELDAYIVMPNHVHGILIINKQDGGHDNKHHGDNVETRNIASLPSKPPQPSESSPLNPISKNKFGPQSKNLASIVRGFKIGVTKNARLIQPDFTWQPRYHDHIIRDERSFINISNYIINNPAIGRKINFSDKTLC